MPSVSLNGGGLSRSGTLSWQQRPLSRQLGSRSRPQSIVSSRGFASPQPDTDLPTETEEKSRQDIAASLGAKDPSWFRQTADRGIGSAAYRKDNADAESTSSFTSPGMRLPGMSNGADTRRQPEVRSMEAPLTSQSIPARDLPVPPKTSSDSYEAATFTKPSTPPSQAPVLDLSASKPLDLDAPILTPKPEALSLGRTGSILSTSSRPPSPTKGLGGFVESAMMKRSDSVSKRWSVQANAGLKRGDSVAGVRPQVPGLVGGYTPSHSRAASKDVRPLREGNSSPMSISGPVSSHGSEPIPLSRGRGLPQPSDEHATSGTPVTEQSTSPTSPIGNTQLDRRPVTPPQSEPVLARSPSKTLDSRRWSPTKASWLESALNKPPEPPKFTATKSDTPAWRLSMQRSKTEQQSSTAETVKEETEKPVPAPKPMSPPPIKKSGTFQTQKGLLTTSTVTKDLAPSEVRHGEPTPSQSKIDGPVPVEPQDQKPEKPAIPSKRNVTPVMEPDVKVQTTKSSTTRDPEPKKAPSTRVLESASPETKVRGNAPVLKPKPQTPPKTDFRASLKSRQQATTSSDNSEPEFKAVFGKLKRTTTQNYVAPDELKDNISRGKAALNVTGGPQKTQRVDEFKQSILQKKEAMKTGDGAIGKRSEVITPVMSSTSVVPEALAKRMALQKTGSSAEKIPIRPPITESSEATIQGPATTTTTLPKIEPTNEKASLPPNKPKSSFETWKSASTTSEAKPDPPASPARVPSPTRTQSTTAAAQSVTNIFPSVTKSVSTPSSRITDSVSEKPGHSAAVNDPEPVAKLAQNSKLAARINPTLAGILSRSSSPKPAGLGASAAQDVGYLSRQTSREEGPELSHMTKARAKGPKRRAPKSGSSAAGTSAATSVQQTSDTLAESPPKRSVSPKPVAAKAEPSSVLSSTMSSNVSSQEAGKALESPRRPLPTAPFKSSEKPQAQAMDPPLASLTSRKAQAVPKSKPLVNSKSPELRKVSNPTAAAIKLEQPPSPQRSSTTAEAAASSGAPSQTVVQVSSLNSSTPKKVAVLPDKPSTLATPPPSDEKEPNVPRSLTPVAPLTPSKSKLNTPKAPKPSVDNLTKPKIATHSKVSGLGVQFPSFSGKTTSSSVLTPPPASNFPVSPGAPGLRALDGSVGSSSKVKAQLETFFGAMPTASGKVDFDAHAFLSAQNQVGTKSKTTSNQIWEVSGDGKKTPMPPQQEHMLFEDRMYLCVHSMQTDTGAKSTEVYLWCGDEVPEAAVDDAQLFCRKIARENSAKLEVIKQGKERAEFFQALGGIVVTRRNKSSALYMLCGRKHLGHMAFDEVDLNANELRSTQPFLISAKFGKLYLWKGKASDPEDVGCARLIGMDLGLTGEIEEIEEGEEPSSFWELFPARPTKRATSEGGTQQYPKHAPRLYRIEHDRPKSSGGFWGLRASSPPKQPLRALLEDVAPVTQCDLEGGHIHILDSYDELYM
jgi:hypothetical protein